MDEVVSQESLSLPMEVIADLVAGHMSTLWQATESEDPFDPKGCCPECCSPCHAVKWLRDHGLLDMIYADHVNRTGSTFIWDDSRMWVDRKWLAAAWSVDMGCEHG